MHELCQKEQERKVGKNWSGGEVEIREGMYLS